MLYKRNTQKKNKLNKMNKTNKTYTKTFHEYNWLKNQKPNQHGIFYPSFSSIEGFFFADFCALNFYFDY